MVKCDVENCKTKASYGLKQEFSTRCKKHVEKDMVHNSRTYCSHGNPHNKCEDCKSDLVCSIDDCKEKSVYGVKQGFATRCKNKDHRENGMIQLPRKCCVHNKLRERCKTCKGSSLCKHGKRREYCKDCDGSQICDHGRQREHCKDCEGSAFCEHGIKRYHCKDCRGAGICDHGIRFQCCFCNSESNHFCKRRYSNGTRCITSKTPKNKYDGYCARCFVELCPDDPRTALSHLPDKELLARREVEAEFPGRFIFGKQLLIADRNEKCSPANRYIDMQADLEICVLGIEVDENQHKYYDMDDEKTRIMQIYQDAQKNLVIIRFNPDEYIENGKIKNPKMSTRYKVLIDKIREVIDKIESGYVFTEWLTEYKLFFDDDSKLEDDKSIRCSGFSATAKRQCRNKVSKEGMFCYQHKSQATS